METIKITPIQNPTYDKNLLKCICLFKVYNVSPHLKLTLHKHNIQLNILRHKNVVRFRINSPFDYPNNFDYFELVCVNKYKDNSTIELFLKQVNEYLKTLMVNISLGHILEYINKNYNMISKNLEPIDVPESIENGKKENPGITEETEISSNIKETEISSNIKEEAKEETKEDIHRTNSYLNSFYNKLLTITPQNKMLYMLKNKKFATCSNKIELEMIFNEILELSKYSKLVFDKLNPDLYSFTVIKDQIIKEPILTHNFTTDIMNLKKKNKRYKQTRKRSKKKLNKYNRKIVKLKHKKNIINQYKAKSDGNVLDKKIKIQIQFIVTIVNLNTINIYPIEPVLKENSAIYINKTGTLIERIQYYIDNIVNNKLQIIKPKYNNVSLFPVIYNIINNNETNSKQTRKNIKLLTTLSDFTAKKLYEFFEDYGWEYGLQCKKYIVTIFNNLKIAQYALNKNYYQCLMEIIYTKWNDLKEEIDPTCFSNQYQTLLKVRPEKIDIFEKILTLVNKN